MNNKRRVRGFSLIEVMIAMGILAILMLMVYLSMHKTTDMYTANAGRAWIIHQARVALDEMAEDIRQGNRQNLQPAILPSTPVAGTEYPTKAMEIAGTSPARRISFKKISSPDPAPPVGSTSAVRFDNLYTTYMWDNSTDNPTDAAIIQDVANGGTMLKLPGATRVDANNNGLLDEGRLVKITAPTRDDPVGTPCKAKIMSNYLKGPCPAPGLWPEGFQIHETWQQINGNNQYSLRITLVLVFTDTRNKVLEQTLETTVFLRNSQ